MTAPKKTRAKRTDTPPNQFGELDFGPALAPDSIGTSDDSSLDFTSGHRERLRERFLSHGAEVMTDEELLEMLLFNVNPRKDVKPLAKLLLRTFGDLAGVVNAPVPRLRGLKAEGVALSTDNAIAIVRLAGAIGLRMLRREARRDTVLSSWDSLVAYCAATMADETVELFRVIFLNLKNAVIADEVRQRGTVDHTPVFPREVIARALELGATAVVLVHNHPSGDPTPSRADIEMTREIIKAGKPLGVTVHDHLIIGRGRHISFKAKGLM